MPHDYRLIYRRGMKLLDEVGWRSDPEAMFRPPSLAREQPLRLACERLAVERGVPVSAVCEEMLIAARIHHFIAACGQGARDYFLSGHCPLGLKKLGQLSRRMPPFIQAKLPALLAGSVNVVSNPAHAFDTDGWTELARRLPKFRATMEHVAVHCSGTPARAGLDCVMIDQLATKLGSIRQEGDLIEQKLRSVQAKGTGSKRFQPPPRSKPAPDWQKAYVRIAQVSGVLRKTSRDLDSPFWKPVWIPTEAMLDSLIGEVTAIARAAATINSWLQSDGG